MLGTALADKTDYHLVVIRSTVPPGTTRKHLVPILEEQSGKSVGQEFGVCVNPEFLREGDAISDFFNPSQVIIGAAPLSTGQLLEKVYEFTDAPLIQTSPEAAEIVKFASNSFHALKVAFANEIGNLCKAYQIDGQQVMDIFSADRKLNISSAYLKPGFAFGGSCLPKDLRALLHAAHVHDQNCPVLEAVLPNNEQQIRRGLEMIEQTNRKRIGVLGVSFKAGTNDLRESPVVKLIDQLIDKNYQVCIYDTDLAVGTEAALANVDLKPLKSLMVSSLQALLSEAEVVVVTKACAPFQQVPQYLQDHHILIDLVGLSGLNPSLNDQYRGICW